MKDKTELIGVRLPKTLLADIDRLHHAWRVAVHHVEVTRSDILRILLRAGLKHPDSHPPDLD